MGKSCSSGPPAAGRRPTRCRVRPRSRALTRVSRHPRPRRIPISDSRTARRIITRYRPPIRRAPARNRRPSARRRRLPSRVRAARPALPRPRAMRRSFSRGRKTRARTLIRCCGRRRAPGPTRASPLRPETPTRTRDLPTARPITTKCRPPIRRAPAPTRRRSASRPSRRWRFRRSRLRSSRRPARPRSCFLGRRAPARPRIPSAAPC